MPFTLSEAREAFIKQFSLLEASTGTLLAQLHGIASTLNCSISMTEEERKESRKDEGSRGVCQTFTDTISMIRASEKQLKQATLDLDNMVGKSNILYLQYRVDDPHSLHIFQVFHCTKCSEVHMHIDAVCNAIDFLSLLWDAAVYYSVELLCIDPQRSPKAK